MYLPEEVIALATLFDVSPHPTDDRTEAARAALPLRVGRWLRDLVSQEPADVRRRRLEAEAEAELGLTSQPREQAH